MLIVSAMIIYTSVKQQLASLQTLMLTYQFTVAQGFCALAYKARGLELKSKLRQLIFYTPTQQSCKGGILESACPSVRLSGRPSVFYCSPNNLRYL
jgi:hypothetical protein